MSRRKNKKRDRERRKENATFPAKFSVTNVVRVKPGTAVPAFTDIPLGGWVGTIIEVDQRSNPPTYLIEWNRHTLEQMHPVYRNRCERDGLVLESMWLAETDLELDSGGPTVIEQPTHLVSRPLSQTNPEDRIRAIFALTSDDPLPPANLENLRRYARYLKTQLSFPFQAKYLVEDGSCEVNEYRITVVGLLDAEDCDEQDGVLCEVAERSEFVDVPLADLEVRDNRRNRQLIEDYSYWFANWSSEAFLDSIPVPLMPLGTDTGSEQPGVGSLVRILVKCGLFGAIVGAVLGSLLGAVEGTWIGMLVGAAVLGVLGLVTGMSYGKMAGAVNRMWYGSVVGGIIGTVGGFVVGAVIGAMMVAFVGTLSGGIVGVLLSRLLRKVGVERAGSFGWAVIGAGLGAVVWAGYRDQETALLWAIHGAWVGAISAEFLLLASVGFLALVAQPGRDTLTTERDGAYPSGMGQTFYRGD